MDAEYIAALADVEQSDRIKPAIASITASVMFKKISKEDICFNNGLENWFIDLYNKAKVLDKIISARNSLYDIKK